MAMSVDTRAYPLYHLCQQWLSKLRIARKVKQECFGKYADEGQQFYDSVHDFMWSKGYAESPTGFLDKDGGATMPKFRMSLNKIFDAVAMFGPALYHQNPNILVAPRLGVDVSPIALGYDPNNPNAALMWQAEQQQEMMRREIQSSCASVKTSYLNWLQGETDKKAQARPAITESIVRGLGLLRTEMYQPPFSHIKYPRSTYLSEKDFLVDPDAVYWEDVQWMAFRKVSPVNKVEIKFGHAPGSLKGHLESGNNQAELETDAGRENRRLRQEGQSFDLIEYWEIFSKNGFGDKLHVAKSQEKTAQDFSQFGDFCYLAVAQGVPFPLNFPPEAAGEDFDGQFKRIVWPIPFWYDAAGQGGWPVSRLYFYDAPQAVWPVPYVKPVIALVRFVNWCMSFLADKTAASCTTYVAIAKSASENIQNQILNNKGPYTVIELSEIMGKNINEVVSFLNPPDFKLDIWKMVSEAIELIDKGTGLTELAYGLSGVSMRSATEANVKDQNISVRPDDMAQKTEDWLTTSAVREIQAARWFCGPEDVAGAVGPMGARVWQYLLENTDVESVVRDYDYTVEAGSAKKPNKAQKIAQMNELSQTIGPALQAFALQGITGPWNAWTQDLMKAHDIDGSRYEIPEFTPPQEGQSGPSPEEEAQQREDLHAQTLRHKDELHQQQMVHAEEKAEIQNKAAEDKAEVQNKVAEKKGEVAVKTAKAKAKAAPKKAPAKKKGSK